MQIPPIDRFKQENTTDHGLVWWANPEGADFTLTLPDGETDWEEGGEARPHVPSYQFAARVLGEVGSLQQKALEFLARIVSFEKLALDGEPYVIGLHCDSDREEVVVELAWTEDVYVRFSVTFHWRLHHAQLPPDFVWPRRMSFWNV